MFHAKFMLGSEEIWFNYDVPASKKPLFLDMDHIECSDGLFLAPSHIEKFVHYFYKPFDWALPQSFWDEYYQKHGEGPRGIWSYQGPERKWAGDFVSREEIMARIKQYMTDMHKYGNYFDVEERKLK